VVIWYASRLSIERKDQLTAEPATAALWWLMSVMSCLIVATLAVGTPSVPSVGRQ